jgi:poly-gamma-glutamate synthesis protein (capsule biosynthesis protein)
MKILLLILFHIIFVGNSSLCPSHWFNRQPQTEVQPAPTPDTLTLMFIGDVMSHMPQVEAAQLPNGTYDYSPCYRFIAPYIA